MNHQDLLNIHMNPPDADKISNAISSFQLTENQAKRLPSILEEQNHRVGYSSTYSQKDGIQTKESLIFYKCDDEYMALQITGDHLVTFYHIRDRVYDESTTVRPNMFYCIVTAFGQLGLLDKFPKQPKGKYVGTFCYYVVSNQYELHITLALQGRSNSVRTDVTFPLLVGIDPSLRSPEVVYIQKELLLELLKQLE